MAWLFEPEIIIAFLTLSALEIVLGIDNLIFISLIALRLPQERRRQARVIGLSLALGMRLGLLAAIAWLVGLTRPLFSLLDLTFSWRDLVLIGGGLFLLVKATMEIHSEVESPPKGSVAAAAATTTFAMAVAQIIVLDMVFSLDSIITAIGMVDHLPVMIAAVVVGILVMLFLSEPLGAFIERHPTAKMLAMSFLLIVGMALVADGLGFHIPRGYLYFAIAFSSGVEALNILARRHRQGRSA
ncbi:MAG: TerC family protein [Alphaproteobacteria bacterium]